MTTTIRVALFLTLIAASSPCVFAGAGRKARPKEPEKSLEPSFPPATPQQVEKLIAVLKSDAPQHDKVTACRQLSVIGSKDAVPVLVGLLADEKLGHMARYALEPNPDKSVDVALREALGKLKGRLLVGIIGSIGVRRDAEAVPLLAKLLQDADADVIRVTAQSLGKIGNTDAATALSEALRRARADQRPSVADGCLACAEALIAKDKRSDAAAMFDAVAKADLPVHFRLAATQGAILARQPGKKQ